MQDSERTGEGLSAEILRRCGPIAGSFLTVARGVDVEKLVSLLTASGVPGHLPLAEEMRRSYFNVVCQRLAQAEIIEVPTLAIGLLELHNHQEFRRNVENLSGILTTNHDGLLQVASQAVFGAVNLGFTFRSQDFASLEAGGVPLLSQLHGSFTWSPGVPIGVRRLRADAPYAPEMLWLPPAILKEAKAYPFNKLAAISHELLVNSCDVLRVVGSSMTQNDWNVLSLIFNAQCHREAVGRPIFNVELLVPPSTGANIQEQCSYLRGLTTIEHLSEGEFDLYQGEDWSSDAELRNVFAYWLKQKISYHHAHGNLGSGELQGAMAKIAGMTR